MTDPPPSPETKPSPRWPWFCLLAAVIWVAIVRVPLVLNADVHLDSDLAVDGLTLLDACRGDWRLHFPGTPHLGAAPLLLALPGAMVFGANAFTLVVGGVLAYEAVVVAVFVLAMMAFGPRVAAWSMVPLAFATVGTVWLSGRVSGGHLLTVAWSAGALAWFHSALTRGGFLRCLGFGAWCGFGFYLDPMFLSTLVPIAAIAPAFFGDVSRFGRQVLATIAFVIGFGIGDLPREIGYRHDPYDSYQEQFATIFVRHESGPDEGKIDREQTARLASEHGWLLVLDCLPRLIAGHRLSTNQLPTEPPPATLVNGRPQPSPSWAYGVALATVAVSLVLFVAAGISILRACLSSAGAVALAMSSTSALILFGFIINKNIYNSDNYRYLVPLLIPWAIGVGSVLDGLWRKGKTGKAFAAVLASSLAVLATLDTASWYREFGWMDGPFPVKFASRPPGLAWLEEHPEVKAIFGGYWDVYRLAFLTGGRVRGLPFPNYPDRFDASGSYPGRRPTLLFARRGELGGFYETLAQKQGGHVLNRRGDLLIIDWPLPP